MKPDTITVKASELAVAVDNIRENGYENVRLKIEDGELVIGGVQKNGDRTDSYEENTLKASIKEVII